MSAVKNLAKSIAVLSVVMATVLSPSAAWAGGIGGGGDRGNGPSGGEDGSTISASAGAVTFDTSKNGSGGSVGALGAGGNWTPPACWYAPTYTPAQFKAESEGIWAEQSVGADWVSGQRDKYVNGHPYKNFNMDKAGQGYWWTGVPNPDRIADPGALACDAPTFWVDKGKPAPVANSISTLILSQLAYARIRVPATRVTLNPTGKQTVNLNTWAWLNKATFKPVSVTASVALLGMSATTTATPVSLHIDPGTPDAIVHPASGNCPITNGHIGTPYAARDANATPPCGMTYLRASNGGSFPMKATITWRVSWTGTPNGGGTLPTGRFGTTTAVTVQEVQTVVR